MRAHCGLALLASLHGETTVSEAELRLAERHLGAASDDARATFYETVAATLVTMSCGYPCRVAFDGIDDAPSRDAALAAERAIAIRQRLAPGSEGYALRLRARATFGRSGATREEIGQAHWDLLEALKLLSREGESRFRLADALRSYASTMDSAASLSRDSSSAIEDGTRVVPTGSSWVRFQLLKELAFRRESSGDNGQRWSCDLYEVGREMARWVRPSRESSAGFANVHARSNFAGARVALRTQGPEAALRILEETRGRALARVLVNRRRRTVPAAAPRTSAASSGAAGALLSERRRLDRRTMAPDGTRDPVTIARMWELAAVFDGPFLEPVADALPADLTSDLPQGTVLLYFPVSGLRTVLVLEKGKPIRSATFPLDFQELWPLVARYRKLLTDPASDPAALTEIGAALYDGLLGSVDEDIAGAERLIVSTEGFLEHIPFAALLRVRGREARFLGAWKPMSTVLSLSVLRELERRRPAPPEGGVAVFADPRNPAFEALPHAEIEGRQLASVWGAGSRLYQGSRATREALFAEFERARVLHIASHAVTSSAFALGTGIVLTPEDSADDGILRAWELLQRPPLRADLVVLSGCETGPGSEWIAMAEGSFDLSRFFLEAGAGAVLSSSWRISDEATEAFMISFHRGLIRGLPTDEALQAAQSALASSPRWAHPFHWAGFRLAGRGPLGN